MTNTDSSNCSQTVFDLRHSVPFGWTGSVLPSSLTLLPGDSGQANLSVTSPTGVNCGQLYCRGGCLGRESTKPHRFWQCHLQRCVPGRHHATNSAQRALSHSPAQGSEPVLESLARQRRGQWLPSFPKWCLDQYDQRVWATSMDRLVRVVPTSTLLRHSMRLRTCLRRATRRRSRLVGGSGGTTVAVAAVREARSPDETRAPGCAQRGRWDIPIALFS